MASYNSYIYTHMFDCDAYVCPTYNHKRFSKVQSLLLQNIKLPRLHFIEGLCVYIYMYIYTYIFNE